MPQPPVLLSASPTSPRVAELLLMLLDSPPQPPRQLSSNPATVMGWWPRSVPRPLRCRQWPQSVPHILLLYMESGNRVGVWIPHYVRACYRLTPDLTTFYCILITLSYVVCYRESNYTHFKCTKLPQCKIITINSCECGASYHRSSACGTPEAVACGTDGGSEGGPSQLISRSSRCAPCGSIG
jgi:hypothetical protein